MVLFVHNPVQYRRQIEYGLCPADDDLEHRRRRPTGNGNSSVQRGSFELRLPSAPAGLRHGAGGVLMGMGTVLIPGGNDGLILFAIPSLSPHAVPAYAGIFAGILTMMTMVRAFGGQIPRVQCAGDICRTQ